MNTMNTKSRLLLLIALLIGITSQPVFPIGNSVGISINGFVASGIETNGTVYEDMNMKWNPGFGAGIWAEIKFDDNLLTQINLEFAHEEIESNWKSPYNQGNSWDIYNNITPSISLGGNYKLNNEKNIKAYIGLGSVFGHEEWWTIPYWDEDGYKSELKITVDRHYYYIAPQINGNIEYQYKRTGLRVGYSRELKRYNDPDIKDYGPLVEKVTIGFTVKFAENLFND